MTEEEYMKNTGTTGGPYFDPPRRCPKCGSHTVGHAFSCPDNPNNKGVDVSNTCVRKPKEQRVVKLHNTSSTPFQLKLRKIIPWGEPRCSKHGAWSYKCEDCILILKLFSLLETFC
jgi:hypothetical protein